MNPMTVWLLTTTKFGRLVSTQPYATEAGAMTVAKARATAHRGAIRPTYRTNPVPTWRFTNNLGESVVIQVTPAEVVQ